MALDKGKFIVFEGLDGSGHTIQVNLLYDFLKSKKVDVLKTKEPTGNPPLSEEIKSVLRDKKKISPLAFQKLFSKDRKWHLEKIILPALERGEIVICDRYFFSTLSYGLAEGVGFRKLYGLNKDFLIPDIVFFIKTSPATSIKRIEQRGTVKTIFEQKEKLGKILKSYRKVFSHFRGKTKIYFIDGEKSIKKVFEEIKKNL